MFNIIISQSPRLCIKIRALFRIEWRIRSHFRVTAYATLEDNTHFYRFGMGKTNAFKWDLYLYSIPLFVNLSLAKPHYIGSVKPSDGTESDPTPQAEETT